MSPTLPDGRDVPTGSALDRIFSTVQEAHMTRLRLMRSSDERRMYFAGVDRSEGAESGKALRDAYWTDREQRKATR